MKLTLGFSSCPNDTFIFDAMVNGKTDTGNLEFELVIEDVEKLNNHLINKEIDVSKTSFATYLKCVQDYVLLNSGSALGKGVGPLLISKQKIYPDEVDGLLIAVPGYNTTANMLLIMAYPEAKNKTEYLFSDIEEAVLSGETDAGLIIHENRFTYEKKGLKKIIDLGEFWEKETGMPIPLGGIVVRRDLDDPIKQQLNNILKKSVEFAFSYPESSFNFVKQYAQEMEDSVIRQHINLYVNKYTADLGKKGKKAIEMLFAKAKELEMIENENSEIFLT